MVGQYINVFMAEDWRMGAGDGGGNADFPYL